MTHENKLHCCYAAACLTSFITGISVGGDFFWGLIGTTVGMVIFGIIFGSMCLARILDRLDAGVRSEMHIIAKTFDRPREEDTDNENI